MPGPGPARKAFPLPRPPSILPPVTRGGPMQIMLGIIGGSGIYQIDRLEAAAWTRVATPWGQPSDEILTGRLGGLALAFLPRHGRGHVLDPASVPYRANIDALKRLGCTDLLAVSAVGSLREDFAPTSSSTAAPAARPASSAPASSPMSAWPTRPAPASARWSPRRRGRPA